MKSAPRLTAVVSSLLLAGGLAGCADVANETVVVGPAAFALTADTAPAVTFMVNGEEEALYIVYTPVELPIRAPDQDEMNDLLAQPATAPWMQAPWVHDGDLEMSIDAVVTNLTDEEHVVELLLDARTEFYQHVPGITADEEGEVSRDYSTYQQPVILPAMARTRWRITQEEISEAATDFATVINGAPNANQVFFWLNQRTDARTQQYIPSVIPGLVGFNFGILSRGPFDIAVELTVRIRNIEDRLARDEGDMWELPVPEDFTPVAAPVEEP